MILIGIKRNPNSSVAYIVITGKEPGRPQQPVTCRDGIVTPISEKEEPGRCTIALEVNKNTLQTPIQSSITDSTIIFTVDDKDKSKQLYC